MFRDLIRSPIFMLCRAILHNSLYISGLRIVRMLISRRIIDFQGLQSNFHCIHNLLRRIQRPLRRIQSLLRRIQSLLRRIQSLLRRIQSHLRRIQRPLRRIQNLLRIKIISLNCMITFLNTFSIQYYL